MNLFSQNVSHLPVYQFTFRIRGNGGKIDGTFALPAGLVVQMKHTCPGFDSHQHEALVHDDLRKPCFESCIPVKLVQMFICLQTCILHLLFGFTPVTQDRRSPDERRRSSGG